MLLVVQAQHFETLQVSRLIEVQLHIRGLIHFKAFRSLVDGISSEGTIRQAGKDWTRGELGRHSALLPRRPGNDFVGSAVMWLCLERPMWDGSRDM